MSRMPRLGAERVAKLAAVATLLVVWQTASLCLPEFLLPGPLRTFTRGSKLLTNPAFLTGLKLSFWRLGVGYLLACTAGTVLGLSVGLYRPLALYMRGLIAMLQAVPPITWIPFLIILFGFGNTPVITIIVAASFFPMTLTVLNGVEGTSRTHVEVARVMGASRGQLLTKVYWPETLPAVITGAQVAFGNAWRSLIAGEMVGGVSQGLGWSISYSGEVADMAGVLVGIVIVGGAAVAIDSLILERLKTYFLRWRSTAREMVT